MNFSTTLLITLLLINYEAISKTTSTVDVVKQGDGEHTLLFESTDIFDVTEAQNILMEKAERLCGDQFVHLGKYEFNQSQLLMNLDGTSDAKPDTFTLTQEINCENEKPKNTSVVTSDADSNWLASEKLVLQATNTFNNFMGLLKKKKYKNAYAMLSQSMKTTTNYKKWKANKKSFIKLYGTFQSYSNVQITWYKNPVAASEPGIYAAFDFNCQYKKTDSCTGIIILHLNESGEFKIIRQESYVMEKGVLKKIQEKDIDIKPYPIANISLQEWNSYYQLINLKLAASKQMIQQNCMEYFADKTVNAVFYFTTSCHPAYPAWVTLHVIKENNQLHMGQIGYFSGNEPAFAEMFKAFQASTEERRKAMAKKNGWDK